MAVYKTWVGVLTTTFYDIPSCRPFVCAYKSFGDIQGKKCQRCAGYYVKVDEQLLNETTKWSTALQVPYCNVRETRNMEAAGRWQCNKEISEQRRNGLGMQFYYRRGAEFMEICQIWNLKPQYIELWETDTRVLLLSIRQ